MASNSVVDCTGLNHITVIQELWKASKPAAFFALNGFDAPKDVPAVSDIEQLLHGTRGDLDYLNGRALKTDFASFPHLDPSGYDHDNGDGAVSGVIEKMKEERK